MPEDFSQSNIDKLLEDALGGPTSPFPEESNPEQEQAEAAPAEEAIDDPPDAGILDSGGAQSQEDIDALLAGVSSIDSETTGEASTEVSEPEEGDSIGVDLSNAAEENISSSTQSQEDIDSLLADAVSAEEQSSDESAPQDQDAIDDLLSGVSADEDEGVEEQDALDSLLSGDSAEEEEDNLDSLLSGSSAEAEEEPAEPTESTALEENSIAEEEPAEPAEATAIEENPVAEEEPAEPTESTALEETPIATAEGDEIDDILKETTSEEAPVMEQELAPPPVDPMATEVEAFAQEELPPSPDPMAAPLPPSPLGEEKIPEVDLDSIRQSLSLMESGSELESMTGEIASLLGQLSERARRYQNAYQTGNHEVNDLKARFRAEERRTTLLKSEKSMLQEEVLELRSRLDSLENDHLVRIETAKKEIANLESQIRERDTLVRRLEGQVESINSELDQTHTAVTDMEVAVRKANFQEERMRNEYDSERQERARLQRALETREAEIQAIQERASGEASTIFIDELHRLVRRYENEVNVRTGAARDALSALEKLEATPKTQQVYNIVRESLLIASATSNAAGALEQLNQDSSSPAASRHERGMGETGKAVVTINDFVQDLQTLEMESACLDASRLLMEKQASPAVLAGQLYVCPSLREARVSGQLLGTITLMQQLLSAQRALDKTRGRETQETERFYVQIFDLLHHLVRIKVITRATPEAWRFFLDIRGRYSFITSDAQWISYRDKQMRLH